MSQTVNLEKIESEQLISLIIEIQPQLEGKNYGNMLRMVSFHCIYDTVIYTPNPAEQLL